VKVFKLVWSFKEKLGCSHFEVGIISFSISGEKQEVGNEFSCEI
jgi:hypothetical protein